MSAVELGTYRLDVQEQYHGCIEARVECWTTCEVCSDACLREDNVQTMVRCIRLDGDCAAICRLARWSMGARRRRGAAACVRKFVMRAARNAQSTRYTTTTAAAGRRVPAQGRVSWGDQICRRRTVRRMLGICVAFRSGTVLCLH
jgi:hypothetical protein